MGLLSFVVVALVVCCVVSAEVVMLNSWTIGEATAKSSVFVKVRAVLFQPHKHSRRPTCRFWQ